MYKLIKPFGYNIDAESIGQAWIDLVDAIVTNGEKTFDEGRERLSLQNVRIRVDSPFLPDHIINKYANKKNIDDIVHLTFNGETMYDFDVKPSFSPGAKSYYARLKEGKMVEFVVERLAKIPESKKAVISFIHWNDYKSVLANPYDDYLPCIISIQFRLVPVDGEYAMNVVFNSRSIDAYQKSNGNMVAIAMLANNISNELSSRLSKKVLLTSIDGLITDAHIYQECYKDARKLVSNYKKYYK
jgi:thymidylate synthase